MKNENIEKEFEKMKNAYANMFDNITIEQFKQFKEKVENKRKITAKDMFEKIGYKYYYDDGIDIFTRKNNVSNKYFQYKDISFHKINKEISIYTFKKDINDTEFLKESSLMKINFITLQELQAIDKMCKELEWYNEQ